MAARVAVAGGGLAGLACGALLARAGAQVTVYEGGPGLGGMAATLTRGGFLWNWGGHALYRDGPGVPVLRELGVDPDGFMVQAAPYMEILRNGRILPAPFGPEGPFAQVLDAADQLELGGVFAALPATRREDLASVRFADWLDAHVRRPRVREVVLALVRLSTYVHDPALQSADAAIGQLRLSLSGAWYLHGGWQQLVTGLRRAAESAGAAIRTHARVAAVEHGRSVEAVRMSDGTTVPVDAAVVAVGGPRAAARLLDGPGADVVAGWSRRAVPVKVATWDLSLRRQPAGSVWVLGADVPVYVNVHSHFARVAPPGAAMVHVVRYLGGKRPDGAHRVEMEHALDQALPGWRDELVDERFLPALTVTHDHPSAATGGLPGRPGPLVDDVEGLAVVGDWIGARGLLADAVLASAEKAASELSEYLTSSAEALV